MDIEEFRKRGHELIDYICDYYKTLPSRHVFPDVEVGYLSKSLPKNAPEKADDWKDIMKDTDKLIMKGITHWQHPNFYAYFPAGSGFPSLLGLILSESIGVVPFSWSASPACTELEIVVMDWLCKAFHLPKEFLSTSSGGGVINASASDNILNCVIAARHKGIKKLRGGDSKIHGSTFLPQFVAYCSEDSHSSTEKAIRLAMIKLSVLPTDENNSLRGKTLKKAIEKDIKRGLTPIFLSCTFGTTSTCAVDNFEELGPICKKYDIWMHIDAAYAGSSLICPEIRNETKGLEYADSMTINLSKWLLVHIDCACLWVRDKEAYCSPFIIDPLYLRDGNTNNLNYDLRHWGVPLTRRFRALKVWYTLRSFGLEYLRNYQRNHIELAKYMGSLMEADPMFEILSKPSFGLLCFKLANSSNSRNQEFLNMINSGRNAHMVPTRIKGNYAIRFAVTHERASKENIDNAFKLIKHYGAKALEKSFEEDEPTRKVGKDPLVRAGLKLGLLDMVNPIMIPLKDGYKDDEDDDHEPYDCYYFAAFFSHK